MRHSLFAGSGTLLRFIIRRDKTRLVVWLLGLTAFAVMFVPVFENIIADNAGNSIFAAMMENPAMVAIVGPAYGVSNYHTGAMFANMMLLFSVMIAGVMNIFFMTRHTRQDEEQGRLEMIRSLPVGRLSNLSASVLYSLLINILLALVVGAGMFIIKSDGMDFNGCMLFGAAMGATGLFFGVATVLFCQFTANNRTASGLSLSLLLITYMMRAVGDLGPGVLSLISPLGLVLRTKVFVDNTWYPLFIILTISVIILVISFTLAHKRDLGRGLVPERSGHRHASGFISGTFGLTLKLLKSTLIIWGIVVFLLAVMYGSVFGDMEGFIESNEMVKEILAADDSLSLIDQFIVKLVAIMSMISTVSIISFINRAASEEKRGHTEHILSKSVSCHKYLASFIAPAFIMSIILQLLTALGFWSAGSAVLDEIPSLGIFMAAALSYLPAMWVFMGIAVLLVAFFPGKTFINYIYLGYSFFSVYLGGIAQLPEWTKKITPFGLIPQYPAEAMAYPVLVVIAMVSVFFIATGFIGYRKRDVQMQ